MGEVLSHDETTVLVVFFEDYLLELLADGIHDLLEAEGHALVGEFTNVLVELFVDFLGDPMRPGGDLVVDQLDLLVYFFSLLALFVCPAYFLLKPSKFR